MQHEHCSRVPTLIRVTPPKRKILVDHGPDQPVPRWRPSSFHYIGGMLRRNTLVHRLPANRYQTAE